jgi:hypothetical protein
MNKSTRLFVRISDNDKQLMWKAARGHKNLSAFLLSAARLAIKYRKLLVQAEAMAGQFTKSELRLTASSRRV